MVSFVFVTLYSLLPAGRWLLLGEQDPPRLHFISHTEVEGGPTKLLLVVQDGVAVSVGITLKSISFFFVSIANKRIGGGGEYVRFEGSIRSRRRKEKNKRERDSGSCNFRRGPTHSIRTGRKALQGEGERESSGCFGSNAKGPSRQRNERGRRVVFLSACYFLTDPSKTINDPKDKRERERGPSLLLLLLHFLLVFCCLLSFNGLQAAVCKNLTSVYCY